jgi:aldose 1-epimerase
LAAAEPGIPSGQVHGRPVRLYTLDNGALRARVTDYAGALVSLEVRLADGGWQHVLLGFDDVSGYLDNRGSFGALLGRTANRIAGGRLTIDGRTYELSKNEGSNTLHGGAQGFGKHVWRVGEVAADYVQLSLVSPDGDQGFPGEVAVEAT